MRKERLDGVDAFITKDGSEIRELAGTPTGNSVKQSLAEATVPPGADTEEHYHRVSEEIYLFTSGSGRMKLGDEEAEVSAGDTIVIPPGVPHKVGSKEGMRMLMVYSPPGLEGMMKAMKGLSPAELADGALTSRILAEHDTVVLGEAASSKGYGSVWAEKQHFVTVAAPGWVDLPNVPGRNGARRIPPTDDLEQR